MGEPLHRSTRPRGLRRAPLLPACLAVAGLGGLLAASARAEGLVTGGPCRQAGLAVQVLGSGGPIPEGGRASAGYLVWTKGRARLLVDAGGGVFLRFGEAGARLEDLDAILLSHLHVDHSADLAALIKGAYFIERRRALPLVGPAGNADFPGTDAFLAALLAPATGAYRYLGGFLDGRRGFFRIEPKALETTSRRTSRALTTADLEVDAVGVEHGPVPALGYLVRVAGKRLAFAGDQSGSNPAFVALAADADLLIMHHPIPESATELRRLHATPSEIGRAAAATRARRLVLSHLMGRAARELQQGLSLVRRVYRGPVEQAADLQCFVVTP